MSVCTTYLSLFSYGHYKLAMPASYSIVLHMQVTMWYITKTRTGSYPRPTPSGLSIADGNVTEIPHLHSCSMGQDGFPGPLANGCNDKQRYGPTCLGLDRKERLASLHQVEPPVEPHPRGWVSTGHIIQQSYESSLLPQYTIQSI
jgi:hypothetical protein